MRATRTAAGWQSRVSRSAAAHPDFVPSDKITRMEPFACKNGERRVNCVAQWATMENEYMSKLVLAAVFTLGAAVTLEASLTLGATSAMAEGGGGGGYDGAVMANVYEYLSAHGCPGAGFSLLNCYPSAPGYRYKREARRYGNRAAPGTSAGLSR